MNSNKKFIKELLPIAPRWIQVMLPIVKGNKLFIWTEIWYQLVNVFNINLNMLWPKLSNKCPNSMWLEIEILEVVSVWEEFYLQFKKTQEGKLKLLEKYELIYLLLKFCNYLFIYRYIHKIFLFITVYIAIKNW